MNTYSNNLYRFILQFTVAVAAGWLLSVFIADLPLFVKYLQNTAVSKILIRLNVFSLHKLLDFSGFSNQIINENVVRISGTRGVLIIYSCLALRHIAHFTGFMLIIGGPVKNKILFITIGICIIFIVNIIRIYFATIAQVHWNEFEDAIHYYGGRISLYGSILLMWIYWLNKYTLPQFGLTSK